MDCMINHAAHERFMDRISPEPMSGCWLWLGPPIKDGYGLFVANRHTTTAHRWAWMLFRGAIPDGKVVCHHCDNPACVNPDHLFVGTLGDNMQDMHDKNRHPNSPKRSVCRNGHNLATAGLHRNQSNPNGTCEQCRQEWWKKHNLVRRDRYRLKATRFIVGLA